MMVTRLTKDQPTLAEWIELSGQDIPCINTWGSKLIGSSPPLSWNTFHRDRDEVVQELGEEGIPVRAAREICLAVQQVFRQQQRPLAILWDFRTISADQDLFPIISRIKSLTALHGKLVTFRVYSSKGIEKLSRSLRNQFRDSGCSLVDCSPTNTQSGICIDTSIAVDAMKLAFTNVSGGSICLITNSPDFAYVLHGVKQAGCKTLAMSDIQLRGFCEACDFYFDWTQYVLAKSGKTKSNSFYECLANNQPDQLKTGFDEPITFSSKAISPVSMTSQNESFVDLVIKGKDKSIDESKSDFDTLDTRWSVSESSSSRRVDSLVVATPPHNKDLLMLWVAIELESSRQGNIQARKSAVGGRLKHENPVRFRDRENLKSFFRYAVSRGFVEEVGNGPEVVLRLPTRLQISFLDNPPCAMDDVPHGLADSAKTLPYLAFVPKSEEDFTTIPGSIAFEPMEGWNVLGFSKKVHIIFGWQKFPWLKNSVFVDWHSVQDRKHWENITVSNVLPFGIPPGIPPEDIDFDESGNPASQNLYVSGYGFGTTVKEIRDLFSEHVPVISVIPKFNNAYMFVNTSDLESAIKTRQILAGAPFKGGNLKVLYCKS